MQVTAIANQEYVTSFKSLCIPDEKLRHSIYKNANKKQKALLDKVAIRENENPVHAIIYSKFGFLRARIFSNYFILGFKEYHKQTPIFESKTSFIERVADVIHDYNERLKIAKLAEHVK